LSNIGELRILHELFGEILVPPAVVREFGEILPEWAIIKSPRDKHLVNALSRLLGDGESEAIALALELKADFLILDDLKARKIAREMGVKVMGTAGVLLLAKKRGIVGAVKPLLSELVERGFRISPEVIEVILKAAGEG
jgi:predicted nucleic acid-binding protein